MKHTYSDLNLLKYINKSDQTKFYVLNDEEQQSCCKYKKMLVYELLFCLMTFSWASALNHDNNL